MSRNGLTFLYALALVAAWNGISSAGTLSSVTLSGSATPLLPGSVTYCSQSDVASAGCNIWISTEDGLSGAYAGGGASSAFGDLSGNLMFSIENSWRSDGYVEIDEAQFTAEFSDPVLITGSTGPGTLVAHFTWSGCDVGAWGDLCQRLDGSSPSFSATAGTSSSEWTANGMVYSGALDLSTPFDFGGQSTIAGSIAGWLPNGIDYSPYPDLADGGSYASLTLTGFSVYDAAGDLVPGAQVTPILNPAPIPEPGSFGLAVCGVLAVWCAGLLNRFRNAGLTARGPGRGNSCP
jgi:hypothetical protein